MPSGYEGNLEDLDRALGADFEHNWEVARNAPTQVNIRNLIRSGCAYIEFLINSLAGILERGDIFEVFAISEFDFEFLRDRSLYIDDRGVKKTRPVKVPIVGRVIRKTEILGGVLGRDGLDIPSVELISRLFERRDRLMHPRSYDDAIVSADDFLDCVTAVSGFVSIKIHFMQKYNEIAPEANLLLVKLIEIMSSKDDNK